MPFLVAREVTRLSLDQHCSANAPREHLGSALAMMNAIGFGLSLPSIALVTNLWPSLQLWVVLVLLPGPVLGMLSLMRLNKQELTEI